MCTELATRTQLADALNEQKAEARRDQTAKIRETLAMYVGDKVADLVRIEVLDSGYFAAETAPGIVYGERRQSDFGEYFITWFATVPEKDTMRARRKVRVSAAQALAILTGDTKA